jgi:plasmid stability protein
MKTITLRGIDDDLSRKLKDEAEKNGTSVNQTAILLLKQGLGLGEDRMFKEYHDLDNLAGTWSEHEYNEFVENTKQFDTIDEELWK